MKALLIVLIPLAGLVAPLLAARRSRRAAAVAAFLPPAISLGLLASFAPAVFAGETVVRRWAWVPEFGLNLALRIDGLGFFFALLILAIGLLIVAYAHWYLTDDDPPGRFFAELLLFMGAMLGVVLAENVILLVVFWELTSISSFLLIGFWHERPVAREGARMALTITAAGGLALLGGMLLLGDIVGSYALSDILASGGQITDHPLYLPVLALVLGGAFTKSAQFPFHAWLPNAMTAPTPVSAYLHSATMVKAGIFLMARLHPALAGTPTWTVVVTGVGLFTMIFAAWVALRKHDLKGLLAYSTVSHLGLITASLGLSSRAAVLTAVFHVFNHAAFKASLFMTAGIVDHEAGTRDMRELGGLRQSMPIVFTLALIGAAGMAGVPLFNGFLSKEMFFEEIVHAAGHAPFDGAFADLLLPLGATLGGILSVAYSIRFVVDTFLGDPPDDFPGHPHDPSAGFWAPVAVLAALTLVGGIAPNLVARPVVEFAAAAAATGSSALEAVHDPHFKLWHGFTVPLAMSAVAFGGGAAIFALRRRVFAFYRRVGEVRGKTVFDGLVDRYVDVARAVTEGLQNGSLQRYAAIVVTTALVAGAAPFWTHSFEFSGWPRTAFNVMDLVGAGLLAAGALAAAVAERHRMQSLISVGLVGLMLALTFVHFSAPDLAMTQLSVEVVNVLLLLLALYTLPETGPPVDDPGRRLRDAALGTAAGAGVGFLSYSVMTRGYDRMADYFLINSYPLAHGENVVNVILVDFRAFDTMGEISVLVVAALGIASMSAGPKPDVTIPRPSSRERFPMILSHVTRPLMALVLAAAVYIFLRGHNNPGGGFIAGLVATVALVLQYVAHGKLWAEERMRIDFEQLAVIGVLIAIVSGAAAWLTGAPFLAQGTAELHLPIFGPLDLVSTLAFDTGVFLAVVGAVMSALLRIGEFNRKGSPDPIDPLLASGEEDDPWKA